MLPLRRPSLRASRSIAALAVAGLVALSGCGGSDDASSTTTTTRPAGSDLNDQDAEAISQVLFRDYQSGGAEVSASADYSPEISVALAGTIDWAEHTGALTSTTTFANGAPQEVQDIIFSSESVFTKATPQQAALLAGQGTPDVGWIERAPDVEGRPLDQVIDLLVSLAATRADNPQLVLQGEGSFEGTEQVGPELASIYTVSGRGTYWIGNDTGHLLRFKGTLPGFAGPVTIDLSKHGDQAVDLPDQAVVAPEPDGGWGS